MKNFNRDWYRDMDKEFQDMVIIRKNREDSFFRKRMSSGKNLKETAYENQYLDAFAQSPFLNIISCGESFIAGKYEAGRKENITDVSCWELELIYDGEAAYRTEGCKYFLKRGDVLLHDPARNASVHVSAGKSCRKKFIVFTNDQIAFTFCRRNVMGYSPLILRDAPEGIFTMIDGICECGAVGKPDSSYVISRKIYALLTEILRIQQHPHLNFRFKIYSELEKTTHEKYDLDRLSALCGMSRRTFNRFFRRNYDMTPVQYIRRQRMNYAANAIESSTMNLKEIAERCTYSTLSHFSADFRKVYGIAPAEFRKRKLYGSGLSGGNPRRPLPGEG